MEKHRIQKRFVKHSSENEKNIKCIYIRVLLEVKEPINPGGSLGSDTFKVSLSNSIEDVKSELTKFHGYDVTNNIFFKKHLKGKKIVEFGCGHGLMTLLLSEFANEVHSFDVDKEAIEFANQLKQTFGVANVRFEHYGGYDLPVPDEQFDCVISADVIEHVKEPLKYLKEAYRVLKKDGLLLLTTPNGLIAKKNKCIVMSHSKFHFTEYYPSELYEMLSNSKFDLIESFSSKNISGGGYRINGVRKIVIKTLCKIGLYGLVSSIKNTVLSESSRNVKSPNNATEDFVVTKRGLEQINDRNCDAIFIIARK